jgi:acyl transferase domain-containing protein
MFVLKRLEDAIEDQDTVWGVIKGIGLSNDMGGSLLAPASEGQVRAMQQAYAAAGWMIQDVDFIECHGAGTPLGDRTELRSLSMMWPESSGSLEQCPIGSVKSNIGHLLTAAGAAGVLKVLLAMKHGVFPPSLHFHAPPNDSPMIGSPFRVQTQAGPWNTRSPETPRRAAVSAFGFGGINAHVLLEAWRGKHGEKTRHSAAPPATCRDTIRITDRKRRQDKSTPIAIVGMDAAFGRLSTLRLFQQAVFNGIPAIGRRPAERWRGAENIAAPFLPQDLAGAFMQGLSLDSGAYRLPPIELQEILPQYLLMLCVSGNALKDANMPAREKRTRMGVVVGADFDFEATDFHLRWMLKQHIQEWRSHYRLNLDVKAADAWLADSKTSLGHPLTASRTQGALTGIIASRIAKELLCGGQSLVVSCEDASGMRALEIGVRSLQQKEMDAVLVGAVDFTGDVRSLSIRHALRPYSTSQKIHAFDVSADGTLPGEGAVALVLKRMEDAVASGDRIYAVIKGLGSAGGAQAMPGIPSRHAYLSSLEQAFQDADVKPGAIGLMEAHGSGIPEEDKLEAEALNAFFASGGQSCALSCLKPVTGHSGAAAGLASLAKAGLCLFHSLIPPLPNYTSPAEDVWRKELFHVPLQPQFWLRNSSEGARRACVGAMTGDGNCAHVILEEYANNIPDIKHNIYIKNKRRPLGWTPYGLFVLEADDPSELLQRLKDLHLHLGSRTGESTVPDPEQSARAWYLKKGRHIEKKHALSLVLKAGDSAGVWIHKAKEAVLSGRGMNLEGQSRVAYAPEPLGESGGIAFLFPGSGNHYMGMGRAIGVQWPEILHHMDWTTPCLRTQMVPHLFMPQRMTWPLTWEQEALQRVAADPLHAIFGQVMQGRMMSQLSAYFDIRPSAVIGYSLGEATGLYAMGGWTEGHDMLQRMLSSNLFTTELAGPCHALRKAWHIDPNEPFSWKTAVVNQPAAAVKKVIEKLAHTRLLIVNTPGECVIGGEEKQIRRAVEKLKAHAVYLDGVSTVHCDALAPVADAYKNLHLLQVDSRTPLHFYSCAWGKSYPLTRDSAASSIRDQALYGFDFSRTIRRAYADGIRIFMEMGPGASCTRMVRQILADKPHLAISACRRTENDVITILKFLGAAIAERVPVNLARLYGNEAYPLDMIREYHLWTGANGAKSAGTDKRMIFIPVGGKAPFPVLPPHAPSHTAQHSFDIPLNDPSPAKPAHAKQRSHDALLLQRDAVAALSFKNAIEGIQESAAATAQAHEAFLRFSKETSANYAKTLEMHSRLLKTSSVSKRGELLNTLDAEHTEFVQANTSRVAFTREDCLEFATGSAARVLGPEFEIVDTFKARVRLPDEPLMLVDRILEISGEKQSLSGGRIVTEHDVRQGAWYLDGNRAPVCISVEAGQADLFLCSYLGIDHAVRGERTYRLLDATVTFYRGLPKPGETIRYEIEIEKFIRQKDTYLFLFNFKGFIGGELLIRMKDGCAGFFTEAEVRRSGGILVAQQKGALSDLRPAENWSFPVPVAVESYDDDALNALRQGRLEDCFGKVFKGKHLSPSLRLPGGKMRLIDRILHLDPYGGAYGLGLIRAEADIHPDDWFLTCHFTDDRVMPGTLMYECCAHTLRVFLQRIGWITDKAEVRYEPVAGIESVLKCRGPVTPRTRHVVYEIEIRDLGLDPEPYAVADAHMFADGRRIVFFDSISMKLSNATQEDIRRTWRSNKQNSTPSKDHEDAGSGGHSAENPVRKPPPLFDRDRLEAFAGGKPSQAFGERYRIFDSGRFIARLPRPPYLFMDRVVDVEAQAWELKPGAQVIAQVDIQPNAWFFQANRAPGMPLCVLNEIALQPCGWLAAYMGSALRSQEDLRFRNLGGQATIHADLPPGRYTLTTRARLTQMSIAGDMIIEHFDFEVLRSDRIVYEGSTNFGFFTTKALASQSGIRKMDVSAAYDLPESELQQAGHEKRLQEYAPQTPEDPQNSKWTGMGMPATAIRMIDCIDAYFPHGGPRRLGYIAGSKAVDSAAWFFEAHFYQDPVCPGSLGLDSLIQLLKYAALDRWKSLEKSHRFSLATGQRHQWTYRGQITPANRRIELQAIVTRVTETPFLEIHADGLLKVDGLCIYKMENFGLRLVSV